MADTAWYYARNGQKVGPVSLMQLQALAAAGQLSPADMLWQAGMAEWMPASTMQGLFPAAVPVAAPAGAPGATRSAVVNALENLKPYAGRFLREGRETVVATWRQTVRLANYGKGLWHRRALGRAALNARLVLGDAAHRAGLGDEQLRSRLDELVEQIRAAEAAKRSTKSLLNERRQVLLQLADVVAAEPEPPAVASLEHDLLKKAQATLQKHEEALGALKAALRPNGPIELRRLGFGYGILAVAVLFCLATLPGGGRPQVGGGAAATPVSAAPSDRADSNLAEASGATSETGRSSSRGGSAEPPNRLAPETVKHGLAPKEREATHTGKSLSAWMALLQDKDDLVRMEAAEAVAKFGPQAKGALPALLEILKNEDDLAWPSAMTAIGAIGSEARDAVQPLMKLLRGKDPKTRAMALGVLGQLGPSARDAVPTVIALLKDRDHEVRGAAARELSLDLGKANIDALFGAFRKGQLSIDQVSEWLESIKPEDAYAVQDLVRGLKDPDASIRSMSLRGLGRVGANAKPVAPAIVPLLNDRDAYVRDAAASALAKIDPGRKKTGGGTQGTAGVADKADRSPALGTGEGALDPLVKLVLGATSTFYAERGFKEYKFGMSRKEAEALSPLTGKQRSGWLMNKDQAELLFSSRDELVAVGRVYRDDNETYVERLKDLFGKTDQDNIETFSLVRDLGGTQGSVREEVARVTYQFPESIAVVRMVQSTQVFASGPVRTRKSESVGLAVYDARWARQQLDRDIKAKRKVMEWLRKVVEAADKSDPDVSLMPEFPGAECKGGAGKRSKSVYYLDPTLSAEQKKERIKAAPRTIGEVLSRDPGWFCLFEKLTERSLKEGKWLPQGTWVVSLRFSVVPGVEPTPLLNTTLLHKVIRCNAALVQEYLPPKGDTVTAVTERDSTVKTFEWRTKENLKVQVTSNTVVITMTPSDPLEKDDSRGGTMTNSGRQPARSFTTRSSATRPRTY